MLTDPIADMLTRIRNVNLAVKKDVNVPLSKIKVGIAEILKKEGFIEDFEIKEIDNKKFIHIDMRYGRNDERVIDTIKRESKPGRRIYLKYNEIPRVLNGYGIAIISTSKGLMTGKAARLKKIGGEIICKVW